MDAGDGRRNLRNDSQLLPDRWLLAPRLLAVFVIASPGLNELADVPVAALHHQAQLKGGFRHPIPQAHLAPAVAKELFPQFDDVWVAAAHEPGGFHDAVCGRLRVFNEQIFDCEVLLVVVGSVAL